MLAIIDNPSGFFSHFSIDKSLLKDLLELKAVSFQESMKNL